MSSSFLEVYLGKRFNREKLKLNIPKEKFDEAIKEITHGASDPLGHKLYKKRIGGTGRGKSGAYRAITYYRDGSLLIFIELFSKNDKENITDKEKQELILLSKELDLLTKEKIDSLVRSNKFIKYAYVAS